jgi:tetratricopeptide (TPR) repeat protein
MAKKKITSDHGFENVENVLSKTEKYIEENQKSLTIIVLVIALITGAYLGYKKLYLAPREQEAQSEMYVAEQYFEADSFLLALEGDGSYMGFIDIIDEYGITKCANLANYYAGISYFKLGEYEEAIECLKKFESDDIMVATVALGAIGDAYVELGELETAVEFYMKAADRKKNDFTSALFLKKAGIVYEELGDYKKALEVYEKIETHFPKSEESRDIEKYITRAKLMAET